MESYLRSGSDLHLTSYEQEENLKKMSPEERQKMEEEKKAREMHEERKNKVIGKLGRMYGSRSSFALRGGGRGRGGRGKARRQSMFM